MSELPLYANFTVAGLSTTHEASVQDGSIVVRERLSLVLRARKDVDIQLSSGEHLSAVETHLSLIPATRSRELAKELGQEDIGFLIHTQSRSEPPFVHGAVMWATASLPYYLLSRGVRANIVLTISSLKMLLSHDEPHAWRPGREHFLRIASYTLSSATSTD